MGTYVFISLQGTVYFDSRRGADDVNALESYSKTLRNTTIESTFDALYSGRSGQWRQQDDIVDPFLDSRGKLINTVWIFDLDNDLLRFHKQGGYSSVSLSVLRQRPVSISDFEVYQPPTLIQSSLPRIQEPHCRLRRDKICGDRFKRHRALVHRMLADFAFQWRHVLSGRYNFATFRRLAFAIIRIITLDFEVKELTTSRQGVGGFLVWLHDLPEWEPFAGHIVRVGGVSVVLSQHPCHAARLIRDDFQQYTTSKIVNGVSTFKQDRTYLILSVREVAFYRMNHEIERCTKPERLFDGTLPPSDEAIDQLLEATMSSTPPSTLGKLPIELQEAIVHIVAAGPVERARIRCLLDLGSPFTWRNSDRIIEREEGHRNRSPWSPVESQIYFGKSFSGVAYK